MNKSIIKLALITLTICLAQIALAQCDTEAQVCDRHFSNEFISDGQEYRALLHTDQEAEFNSTLFGGNTYRMVSCSGETPGDLIFSVKDKEGNELFSSAEYYNAPYWDFNIENTVDVTINARLDQNKKESGCAVILIGFKQ
ncbi:MAG: hypothetical protein AB8B53_07445 [Flavobacteriales bacterium]